MKESYHAALLLGILMVFAVGIIATAATLFDDVISNVEAINKLTEEINNLRIDMMGYFDFYKKLAARLVDLEERVMMLEYYLLQSLRTVPK